MRIRGERECQNCETRWSYYDTGSINCPNCGSIRSLGVEEPTHHTDSPTSFDLTDVRTRFDRDPIVDVIEDTKRRCREYVRRRGFVRAGDLLDLDDTYLAAAELAHVADVVGRRFSPTDEEELYLLGLVGGADAGDRPDPETVPESMRAARGLAYANAVFDYRREIREWLDTSNSEERARSMPEVRAALDGVDQHAKRIRALDGDVDPRDAERLLEAVRDLGTALRDGDEVALSAARDRIDRL
jgi:uncharacterized Zn ribbon protein